MSGCPALLTRVTARPGMRVQHWTVGKGTLKSFGEKGEDVVIVALDDGREWWDHASSGWFVIDEKEGGA